MPYYTVTVARTIRDQTTHRVYATCEAMAKHEARHEARETPPAESSETVYLTIEACTLDEEAEAQPEPPCNGNPKCRTHQGGAYDLDGARECRQ